MFKLSEQQIKMGDIILLSLIFFSGVYENRIAIILSSLFFLKNISIIRFPVKYLIFLFLFTFQFIIAVLLFNLEVTSTFRFLYSIILFLILLITYRHICFNYCNTVLKTKYIYTGVVIYTLISIMYFGIFHNFINPTRTILFFKEPSHFSLSFAPLYFLLFVTHKARKDKIFLVISLLFLTFISEATTLVVLVLTMSIVAYSIKLVYKKKYLFFLFFLTVIAFLIFFIIRLDIFFINKLLNLFQEENKSITTLVYLNGWERMVYNFKYTYGLGYGFNLMGYFPVENTDSFYRLDMMDFGHLNKFEGSFLFSKIITEFGFLGVPIIFYLISISIKSYFLYLKTSNLNYIYVYVFTYISSFGGLMRSGGYFTSWVLLTVFFIFIFYQTKKSDYLMQKIV